MLASGGQGQPGPCLRVEQRSSGIPNALEEAVEIVQEVIAEVVEQNG